LSFSTREFDTKALRKSSYAAMPKCRGRRAFAPVLAGRGQQPIPNVSNKTLTALAVARVSWIGW
jgi:hypothetical protein